MGSGSDCLDARSVPLTLSQIKKPELMPYHCVEEKSLAVRVWNATSVPATLGPELQGHDVSATAVAVAAIVKWRAEEALTEREGMQAVSAAYPGTQQSSSS